MNEAEERWEAAMARWEAAMLEWEATLPPSIIKFDYELSEEDVERIKHQFASYYERRPQ